MPRTRPASRPLRPAASTMRAYDGRGSAGTFDLLADQVAPADELPQGAVRRGRAGPVVVEAEAGLAAELAVLDHAAKEHRRLVALIAELAVEELGHREHDVEADEVAQGERAHRVAAAELHRRVDLGGARQAL